MISPIRCAAFIALLAAAASPAVAQQAPAQPATAAPAATAPAVASPVVVVDIERIVTQSAAGRGASAALRPQAEQLEARVRTLRDQFQREGQALQQGVQNGSITQPVAEQRARDLEQRQQTAQTEVDGRQRALQQSNQYVLQQINESVQPIISAVMRERGALIAVPRAATLQHVQGVEITQEVLTRLDRQLPRVNTTPPAQPAAQPRPATPPAAQPPR
jgi:Skp family chaperone for outer membrane proteins